MIVIPTPNEDTPIDDKGAWTPSWGNFFDQNTQQMQQSLSNEGFWIPSVSSDPDSVTPSTAGGQLAQVQASFGRQNGANKGTVIFDPFEINGGSASVRWGQLKVLLGDGTFHKITNT